MNIWQQMTHPSKDIVDIEERRRAQFLSSLMIFLIPISFLGLIFATVSSPPKSPDDMLITGIMALTIVGLVGVYRLSRSRHHIFGSGFVVFILFAGAVGLSIIDPDERLTLLPFLSLCVLITSLLFAARTTAIIAISANLAGILTFFVSDIMLTDDEQDIVVFNLIMGVLIVAAALVRNQYIERIEKQKTQLDEIVVELEDARANLEKRVQERTKQLQEMNDELRRFAYILSHDLRNHLVNFSGFTKELNLSVDLVRGLMPDLLEHLTEETQKELIRAVRDDIPEYSSIIDTSVEQMERMVDAMLELARMEKRQLNLQKIDMTSLVDSVLTSLSTEIKEKEIEIVTENLPPVIADRFSMERIVTNLVHNAVVYSEPNRKSMITIGGEVLDDVNRYFVQDNGIGIHEDDIQQVFDIFRRVGDQTTTGEGMGLAFVRNLVQRHNGAVRCDSVLGLGSKFTFTVDHDLETALEQNEIRAENG